MISRKGRDQVTAWLFVGPALVVYAIFVLIPLVQTVQFSFTSFRGVNSHQRWVGTYNYTTLFHDPTFYQVLKNMAMFAFIGGTLVFLGGLGLATAMQSPAKWAKWLRGIYLVPHLLPVVAIAVLWRFLYLPSGGLLPGLGLHGPADGWLGSTSTALPAVSVAWVWYALGFYAMMFSAGMQAIPEDVNQAAELDGATPWVAFRKITYPLLFPVRRMATIYVIVHIANLFALIQVMTNGSPARATDSLLTLLYDFAFVRTKMGYAAALGTVNLILVLLAAGVVRFLYRKDPVVSR